MIKVVHLVHSLDTKNGGVAEAVHLLNDEMCQCGLESTMSDDIKFNSESPSYVIAHGLWQWPTYHAYLNFKKKNIPYLLFPHGMLDPWFKKSYRLKHIKKQVYWLFRESKILSNAKAVCFTTEEEQKLARNTFFPYECNEVVTGLGVKSSSINVNDSYLTFLSKFPELKNKKCLLYLGRFHPKKGVDILIDSFLKSKKKDEMLVLAGPRDNPDSYLRNLTKLSERNSNSIIWTGMLRDELKWGALYHADALILPSHQENYGMVVAESLSVGTPVFLTNKVNLWNEVISAGAGFVANDDPRGINDLLKKWVAGEHNQMKEKAIHCFKEKLHIRKTVENICKILKIRIS